MHILRYENNGEVLGFEPFLVVLEAKVPFLLSIEGTTFVIVCSFSDLSF